MMHYKIPYLTLSLLPVLTGSTYVYKDSVEGITYDVKDCEKLKGKPKGTKEQMHCMENEGILEHWPQYIDAAISSHTARTDEVLCRGQRGICESKFEYMTDLTEGCRTMVEGCRSALRHLQEMMLKEDPNEQVCNNFALKSVRGFFHDYMSTDIEGSILSENHLGMNLGLCRWTQYINVLSDHTLCDAGSIIQMSGFLGYEACGFPLWEVDADIKPYVFLNGGMSCNARTKGPNAFPKKSSHPLFDEHTGLRLAEFGDVTISADSALQEKFWCTVNPHGCATGDNARTDGKSDGEAEYSGEATAAAHVIGRVTCPITGKDALGNEVSIEPGFFHIPRSSNTNDTGMAALRAKVDEGYEHLRDSQCGNARDYPGVSSSDGNVPTGAVRLETEKWSQVEGETNLNSIGGLCGMPTQFLKTVHVGNKGRVPRFMNIAALSRFSEQTDTQKAQCTDQNRKMYIPLELLDIRCKVALPRSPALDRFLTIAWDGIGTLNSEWDTCVAGCNINVSANRMCGGEGLSDFKWDDTAFDGDTAVPISTSSHSECSSSALPKSIIIGVSFLVLLVAAVIIYIVHRKYWRKKEVVTDNGRRIEDGSSDDQNDEESSDDHINRETRRIDIGDPNKWSDDGSYEWDERNQWSSSDDRGGSDDRINRRTRKVDFSTDPNDHINRETRALGHGDDDHDITIVIRRIFRRKSRNNPKIDTREQVHD